jgi:hypothetical protein
MVGLMNTERIKINPKTFGLRAIASIVLVVAALATAALVSRPPSSTVRTFVSLQTLEKDHTQVVVSWPKQSITYAVMGNLGLELNDEVTRTMEKLATSTGVEVSRTSPLDIVLILDANVFRDLRENPEKFQKIGLAKNSTVVLKMNLSKYTYGCSANIFTNHNGDIETAVVLMSVVDPKCVQSAALKVFGLDIPRNVDSALANKSACLVYAARRAGIRAVNEFEAAGKKSCL